MYLNWKAIDERNGTHILHIDYWASLHSGKTIDPPADIGGLVFPSTFVNSHQASVFQSRLTCVAFAYTNATGTIVIEK